MKPPALTFADAILDPHVFGSLPQFKNPATWKNWITWSKALHGQPLTADEVETFRRQTGRLTYDPPAGGFPQGVCVIARQTGKTDVIGKHGSLAAMNGKPGHYAVLVGQDQRAGLRTLFASACEPFERVPLFRNHVRARRADSLELDNGVTLICLPCRPAAVRGLRACFVGVDELAFFRTSDNAPADREMLVALKPTLATTGGRLLICSSPYAQSGALFDLHRRAFGTNDPHTLVWQADAPTMNPTLPADYLKRMAEDDPEAYRTEVLGEFRSGVSQLFSIDVLRDAVDEGVHERLPSPGEPVQIFVDPASGSGQDAWTAAAVRRKGDTFILDSLFVRVPPFTPDNALAESAAWGKARGSSVFTGDEYRAGFVHARLRQARRHLPALAARPLRLLPERAAVVQRRQGAG